MTKRERIVAAMNLEDVDRPPALGGWLTSADHLQKLAGVTREDYWKAPQAAIAAAYLKLDVDGLGTWCQPPSQEGYHGVTVEAMENRVSAFPTPESVRDHVEKLPDAKEVARSFDPQSVRSFYVDFTTPKQALLKDIVFMPALWDAVPRFSWYTDFGYESYLAFLALYPEAGRKLFEYTGQQARLRSAVYAKTILELGKPPILLTGQDICDNRGPLVRESVLREMYFSQVKLALEPLIEAGFKIVWHCDGNVMPIVDDILECGAAGLQGFQEEVGVDLSELAGKRTSGGERLIFFCGLSVTRTLPYGTEADISKDMNRVIDLLGPTGLFLCPTNTIGPEVPLSNIVAAYGHPKQWEAGRGRNFG